MGKYGCDYFGHAVPWFKHVYCWLYLWTLRGRWVVQHWPRRWRWANSRQRWDVLSWQHKRSRWRLSCYWESTDRPRNRCRYDEIAFQLGHYFWKLLSPAIVWKRNFDWCNIRQQWHFWHNDGWHSNSKCVWCYVYPDTKLFRWVKWPFFSIAYRRPCRQRKVRCVSWF